MASINYAPIIFQNEFISIEIVILSNACSELENYNKNYMNFQCLDTTD